MAQPAPLKTFIIYSSKDRELREQLESHLQALVDLKWIALWSDKEIAPGERWDKAIKKRLLEAEIFLMLISVDFYNSGYIREEEFKTAISRLESGDSMVIPIIVRPCDWESYPVIKDLQVLPPGGLAVTDSDHWKDRDKAWHTIAKKLRERIQDLREERVSAQQKREAALAAEREADLAAEAQRAKEAQENARAEDARQRAEQERRQADTEAERQKQAEQERQRLEKERLAQQAQDAEAARLRAEQERLQAEQNRQRAEQERDRQWHEAHAAAWVAATDQHSAAAYEQFLSRYPNSPNAREARHHIKTLRQEGRQPVAWGRWAGIGAVMLAVAMVVWMVTRPSASEAVTDSHRLTSSDTLRPQDPSQPAEGAKTLSPEQLPDNTGVKKDEPVSLPTTEPPKPAFVFDYKMVRVAGGSYTMGQSDPNIGCNACSADECPHSVNVAAFSIGQTEVTQAQWKAVMGINPSKFKGDNLPVEQVSWNDVQNFIKKLNEKTGQRYRLPTEKEWEYAARGGNRSGGYKYAGSDNLDEVAWYGYEKANKTTHPVARKKANELGLYDMIGNVWEWCQDKYGPYPGCSEPKQTGSGRVLRGGSWINVDGYCRSAVRGINEPGDRVNDVGFRLAQD